MKMFRKILCTALVAMLLVATMMPAMAAAKTLETKTFYASYKNFSGWNGEWININDVKSNKVTNVSSSNKSILTVEQLETSTRKTYSYEDKKTTTNYGAEFYIRLHKIGKANLKYKIGTKSFVQPIAFKAYTNPIASLKIPGVNGGKELKSNYKTDSYASGKLTKATAAGKKINVKAASGWKLTYMYWEDYENNKEFYFSSWDKGVSSLSMYIPAMKAGNRYYVGMEFRNTKTGGTMWCNYNINNG